MAFLDGRFDRADPCRRAFGESKIPKLTSRTGYQQRRQNEDHHAILHPDPNGCNWAIAASSLNSNNTLDGYSTVLYRAFHLDAEADQSCGAAFIHVQAPMMASVGFHEEPDMVALQSSDLGALR